MGYSTSEVTVTHQYMWPLMGHCDPHCDPSEVTGIVTCQWSHVLWPVRGHMYYDLSLVTLYCDLSCTVSHRFLKNCFRSSSSAFSLESCVAVLLLWVLCWVFYWLSSTSLVLNYFWSSSSSCAILKAARPPGVLFSRDIGFSFLISGFIWVHCVAVNIPASTEISSSCSQILRRPARSLKKLGEFRKCYDELELLKNAG